LGSNYQLQLTKLQILRRTALLLNRRRFLGRAFFGAVGLGAAAAVDGFLIEPHIPVVERIGIRLRNLPEAFHGFRIVVMGDMHFGPYAGKPQVERAVRLALPLKADLTILTGDFVSRPLFERDGPAGARHAEPCAEVLQQLIGGSGGTSTATSTATSTGMPTGTPVISILGNHDHWNGPDMVAEILNGHGLNVLRNRSLPLERDGQRIWIVGVDDVYEHANDLDQALQGVPPTETRIVAVHEPDFADQTAKHAVDLQISGHSHGGQVRIPFYGAPILPQLGRKYPIGLNQVRDLQVYTNRGIGVVSPPVRLNCSPEVTLITLVGRTSPSAV
jgi:predicted MPP superfamily phosphohydrolase